MSKGYKQYEKRLDQFWNTCSVKFAHIEGKQAKVPKMSAWEAGSLRNFGVSKDVFANKTVIDYGMGSGRMGVLLLTAGAKKYIAIDIAQRQLDAAKKTLSEYDNFNLNIFCEFHLAPIEFADLDADVFMTLACMQHFPSEEYLLEFMDNLNHSEIGRLLLQYRHAKPARFKKDNPSFACRTNADHLSELLTNYDLIHTSKVQKADYQFAHWTKQNGNP